MIRAAILGLAAGVTLGLCAAPLWMMLQLPMRVTDILGAKGDMRLCALALSVGSALGALSPAGCLPFFLGVAAMALGGVFVGMLAAALTEAVEVIPILFDRLSVTADMRYAACAMALGKTLGAVIAGLIGR